MTAVTQRVFFASLKDYVAGVLHGTWVELSDDADEMQEAINTMLAESPTAKAEGLPAEEAAIHDFEGFGSLRLSEHMGLEELAELARGIEEHGEAFLEWAAHEPAYNTDPDKFADAFRGEWDSLADYVQDYWEQAGLPEAPNGQWWHPANYIDFERMAHDLEMSGDVYTIEHDGKVLVFDNH